MDVTSFLLLSCLGLVITAQGKNCGSVGEVENGHVDYPEGTEFGDKVVITCNPGYRFVGKQGPREIICGDQGWMSRLPVCEAVTCEPPPALVDGTFTPNKDTYSSGDVVLYSCQNGLTLSGSKSVSCSDDGTFQPAPPTCIMVQCKDPDVKNGDWVQGSRPPFGYKATVTFKCRSGFIMNGESTQTCEINNEWSPGLPTCEMVTCEPPPTVAGGTLSPSKDKYVYGEVVQYSCEKGFTLSGSKSVSCSEDGTFKPAPPTCIMVTCEPPPTVAGGTLSPSKDKYVYGEVVQYSCEKGFTLSGLKSVSCSEDGTFKPAPPTCIMVTCEPPPTVAGGTLSPSKDKYVYGEVVQYSCEKGFTLSGLKSVSCSEDGTFKPAPPTCIKMPDPTKATNTTATTTTTKKPTDGQCPDPAVENGERIEDSGPPYRYKTTVTYQCKSGFEMVGKPVQTCEESGQWSPGLPKCEKSSANNYVMPLAIALAAISVLLICCGCFYFGVPARIKKKLGSGRGIPADEATKPEEEVALSVRRCVQRAHLNSCMQSERLIM
ncbi:C4b-binding protein alpha chain-like isoform X2 [Chaetodon auriga]|uniref:C4b-binding protein alpha chain-like isoform X2 n=1 Tax=Chaetodon auriga TaxID=39042 RepID=UPI004032EBB0